MRNAILAALLFALLCYTPPAAHAWNDHGHMLIALLSYRRLSPAQKTKVDEILKQHPHYEAFLSRNKPSDVPSGEWAFLRAAIWPDFVRSIEHRGNFHRARWHYINLPFTPPGEAQHLTGPKFQVPTINILVSIDECRDLLGEDYPSASRKAVHLAWLEHLVGDIHQPLHCITLVNRAYPRGDLGGNQLAVRSGNTVKRLHGYWDDVLGTDVTYSALVAAANGIADDPALAAESFPELRSRKTPKAWADEGHKLAKDHAYLNGMLPFASYESFDRGQLTANEVPLLPQDYEQNARQVAKRRAALASYRLAAAIEQSLK